VPEFSSPVAAVAMAIAATAFLVASAALMIRVWREWWVATAADATRRAVSETLWCLVPLLTLTGLLVVLP